MRNYSKQREEILSVLKQMNAHLTADEIYEKVKKNNSTVSKSTVYRNLKELVDEKIIWKISINDSQYKYDYPKKEHNHVICIKCGKIIDIDCILDNNILENKISQEIGINAQIQTISIYCVCDECKNNKI